MIKRSMAGLAIVALVGLAACGDDGPKTMSERDFLDQLDDICKDTDRDIDKLDQPTTDAELEGYAEDAVQVLEDTRDSLAALLPPSDLQRDFTKLKNNLDDQIETLGDVVDAAADEDEAELTSLNADLDRLSLKRSAIGDDLGSDECAKRPDGSEPSDSVPDDTVVGTTPTPDTEVITTAATATDPPATDPPATDPPATNPPLTLPPTLPPTVNTGGTGTSPPSDGDFSFAIVDLTDIFAAPFGYQMEDSDRSAVDVFAGILDQIPSLSANIESMGVASIYDLDGSPVATLVLGIAISEEVGMPLEWKELLCRPQDSTFHTTPGDITGLVCPGSAEAGLSQIFTLTDGAIGVTLATFDPNTSIDDVIDNFFAANVD